MSRQVVLVVMDGVGKSTTGLGDAVTAAHTPTLDKLLATCKTFISKRTARQSVFLPTRIWATAK